MQLQMWRGLRWPVVRKRHFCSFCANYVENTMAMGAFRTGLAQSSEAARAGNAKKKETSRAPTLSKSDKGNNVFAPL